MTQGKFVYVRRFTRHGKETDNATDNDIDIVVVKVAIYFDYIDYIGEHNLFLVTLIDHCWSLGRANTTPRLSFETVEDLQRR